MILSLGSFVVLFLLLERAMGRNSTLVLYPPLFAALYLVSAARYRHLGESPARLLFLIIPLAGPLLVLAELGFRRGGRS